MNFRVSFIPLQSAGDLMKKYHLKKSQLVSKIHLISDEGKVYKGNRAIFQLRKYFPLLYPVILVFGTKIGKSLYSVIAKNRHKILGCGDACYVSSHSGG